MNFDNSETKKNLELAFGGESKARNKYTYFASIAKKEGYEEIASIFLEFASNEKEHAKIWYKYLYGTNNTASNIKDSIKGEEYEYKEMYKDFETKAREEGFDEIADKFKMVGDIEKTHAECFKKLLNSILNDEVFKNKEGVSMWRCRNCGHIHFGTEAPEKCPVCDHSKSYFEKYIEKK